MLDAIKHEHESSLLETRVFLDLLQDVFMVPAEELAEEIEILYVPHAFGHFAGVEVLEESDPAVVE
jgi:hypothetical protein